MVPSPENIAIVSDHTEVRESLETSLTDAGYVVTSFATGAEALHAIHGRPVDVLLLDTNDSAASVHETIAAVRGSATTETIRIILLVGAGAEERAAALDLGADEAISRPWDGAELLARMRTQLRVRRAESQLLEKVHIAEEGSKSPTRHLRPWPSRKKWRPTPLPWAAG